MSNTYHHRNQKSQHSGHDYGARYSCNKSYSTGYGKFGRKLAASERRSESKKLCRDIHGHSDGIEQDHGTIAVGVWD